MSYTRTGLRRVTICIQGDINRAVVASPACAVAGEIARTDEEINFISAATGRTIRDLISGVRRD